MLASSVFVCECGTRLRIVVEGRETRLLPCPNKGCSFEHVVSGEPVEILLDQNGDWVGYDWKAGVRQNTPL